jgi:ribosome recycling factor
LPPLTEERRKELVKRCNGEGELAKVSIRNIRREAIEQIKKLQKEGLSEDVARNAEGEMQDLTNRFITLVEKHLEAKEKEIMAV